VQQQNSFLKLYIKQLQIDDTDEQLYSCDETALYYKLLPNKFLDPKKAPSKTGMKTNKEIMTFLLCTVETGDHKLQPLCTAEVGVPNISPINMKYLPVI
jgi:hypothetical protein